MKTTLLTSAAASPFAHLLGLMPGAKARAARAVRAEDGEPKNDEAARAEDSDEDDEPKKDPKDDGAKKGKRRARADDGDVKDPEDADEDEPVASDADDEEDEPKKEDAKKGKSKAKADDDEYCAAEDDDDEDVAAAARAGRLAERARARKIFSSKAAGQRPDVAAQLAFTTDLSSAEAIGVLEAAAAGGLSAVTPSRLHQRMARVVTPDVGHDVDDGERKPDSAAAQAKAIVGALNKAQGRKA